MALDKKTSINVEKDCIVLMSLKISNQYKPSYQPDVLSISIIDSEKAWQTSHESDDSTFDEDVTTQSDSTPIFYPDKPYDKQPNQYNKYLVSFQLPPGKYEIGYIYGASGFFPIRGNFGFPVNAKFEVFANSITYIGHLEMINQKRKDGDRKSGSIFPLIDQAVSGFSNGTFKLNISDNYDEDIELFKKRYPSIKDYTIINNNAVLITRKLEP